MTGMSEHSVSIIAEREARQVIESQCRFMYIYIYIYIYINKTYYTSQREIWRDISRAEGE